MPIYLEPRDITAKLEEFSSVLVVSCPICPPMCVSVQQQKPFLEFFKHGLKTEAFEDYIRSIREPLEQRGIRTGVYTMRLPVPMMCLWTQAQRNKLLRRAMEYDSVLVLGCDSATYTAIEALKETTCQVFQAMQVVTITNATAKFRFPMTVELKWHPLPTSPSIGKYSDLVDKTTETEKTLRN